MRLKRLLGEKAVEVDFFKLGLRKVEARRQNSGISGQQASTMQFVTPLQGSLSMERGVLTADNARAPLRLVFSATLAPRWMPGLFPEKPNEDLK